MSNYDLTTPKGMLDWSVEYSKKRLQELVKGDECEMSKQIQADANIKSILQDVLPLLSKGRQREIQICLDLREHIWHPERSSLSSTQTDGSLPTLQAK